MKVRRESEQLLLFLLLRFCGSGGGDSGGGSIGEAKTVKVVPVVFMHEW